MEISAQALGIISTLWDLIRQDGTDGNHSNILATELSQLPDFDGSRATAGYYVTSDGDIIDDHWWLVMDDDSVLDAAHASGPRRCSNKDPRHGRYFPYAGDKSVPIEVLQLADHLKGLKRVAHNKTFREMLGEEVGIGKVSSSDAHRQSPDDMPDDMTMGGVVGVPDEADDEQVRPEDMQLGWNDLLDEDDGAKLVTPQELRAIEAYADRIFAKVGLDIAFSRHFLDRVNDPRNEPEISVAELVRLFKQQFRRHGRRIPRLGPEAEAVMKDMATDVNVPFVLKLDRNGMLTLLSKTIMRKPEFGTSDEVFAVEVDHPEYMPGGDNDSGYDPTYDERRTQTNPGHPRP